MTPEPGTAIERRDQFEMLYSTYADRVLGYSLRRAPRAEAEEIVSGVFFIAWRRLADLPGDPLPWLLATARNVLRNQRRSGHRRGALTARISLDPPPTRSIGTADQVVEAEQAGKALKQLTEPQREAVLLVAWDGLTRQQAATVLGCSRATLAVRLHRARRTLAAALDPHVPHNAAPVAGEPNPMEEQT